MSDALITQLSHLPVRLAWHILLTMTALGSAVLISLPLAILATRVRVLSGPLVGTASVIQTIPSLAILALMVLILGQIGFLPAFIALLLYGLLPILRNAVTGLDQVDPNVIEAARGVGMSPGQILRRVQFPLALPVIIAGVRTSAVWIVGIATLSTPVGQSSLGDYIFQGLQLRNNTAIIVGCVAAAGLALVLDGLIHLMEVGASNHKKRWMIVSAIGLVLLGCVGVTPLFKTKAQVQIGAKTFTEQYILAQDIGNHLQTAGITYNITRGMGSTILFDSLANNSVDVYVDYTGTLWSNILKREDIKDADTTYQEVAEYLQKHYGIKTIGRLGFANAYALAIRKETAEKYHLKTITDLARYAPQLTIAGDYEFFARPEWKNVKASYGLRFSKEPLSMDSSLMYNALRDNQGVDVVSVFSTDGRIAAYDLVVLKDPHNALPPYDAVLMLSPEASQNAAIVDALKPMVDSISDGRMRRMNKAVDLDGKEITKAAKVK